MNEEFQSIDELYRRVFPALQTRVHELSLKGIKLSEMELWTCLRKRWKFGKNLTLFDIVHDIMMLDIQDIKND